MTTYTEEVTRFRPVTSTESIEVPDGLVKLVNGRDKKFGRNGYHYMGCERVPGGHTIDRLQAYISHHRIYCMGYGHPCDCPIKPE
jgi:hypothetical protein